MQLPPREIEAIRGHLKKIATQVYAAGQKTDWPAQEYRTSDNPKTPSEFPSHFERYVLISKIPGNGNHGQTSGTALSTTTNELVYWATTW